MIVYGDNTNIVLVVVVKVKQFHRQKK